MREDETYKLKPAYLLGAIEALQTIVEDAVLQLPERAMFIVAQSANDWARQLEAEAAQTGRNDLRTRAAAAHDIAAALDTAVDQQIYELGQGARIRTIQPAPLPPGDLIDKERGF